MTSVRILPLLAASLLGAVLAENAGAQVANDYPIPTANSKPLRITVGPDGNLWFAESGVNKIGRITPAGVITEFPTTAPLPDGPNGVCTGPDGNIWFTMQHGKLGRMTPTGAATLFGTLPGAQLGSSVAGPDGNIWFTDPGLGRVFKATTAGVTTAYTPPSPPFAEPNSITSGPDGALWFTDTNPNRIGRITTSGAFTFFTIPSLDSSPQDIVLGPDGNLWFTETNFSTPNIGRITPAGVITEFPTPNLLHPGWIAAGPDGFLWFTVPNIPGWAGRLLPNGSMLEFPAPTANGTPAGIVAGPDGALWFAEYGAGKIARITTSATFHTLAPCRVADTRLPDGPYGGPALDNSFEKSWSMSDQCGIPATATGVSFNFTVTEPTARGFIRIYPSQSVPPDIQTLSFSAGQTRANNAVLGLGPNRDITVHVDLPDFETVHFIIDVNGYFQ